MKADIDQKVLEELRKVIADAEDMMKASGDRASDKFESLRGRFQDTIARANRTMADAESAVTEKAKLAARAADDYVHDKPWQSVGIAGAVGVLVGMLIARR